MARISTYAQDPLLEGADRVIGSDASNANATMNFSLASLGDFYTKSGLADATRLGYRFNIGDGETPGTALLGFSSGAEFANVTSIRVSPADVNGFNIGVLNAVLGSGGVSRVKVVSTRQQGNNEVAQGYYTVSDVSEVTNASGVILGYDFTLVAISEAQRGSLRIEDGATEPDESIIILPLPSNAAGTGTGTTQNIFDAIVVDGGDPILADTSTDDLLFVSGTGISLAGADPTGGAQVTVTHGDTPTTGADGNTNITNTGQNFIQSIEIDQFGHIVATTPGEAQGMQTSQLPFPVFSGSISEAGFTGNTQQATFQLENTEGFTITDFTASVSGTGFSHLTGTNSITVAAPENTIGTGTITASWTATQDNLSTHTQTITVNRTFTIFRPYYSDVLNGVPTAFALGTRRATPNLTNGGTITLTAGAGTQEAVIGLSLTDHATPSFRTGGFLIIQPEAMFDGQAVTGENYRNYVISLTPNTVLELEIL